MKVSVIIPVFNTPSGLLKTCLMSVSSQKDVEVEVVVVDDGSSKVVANSCDLLFKLCDCSGIVVHQENQGLSGARNSGVDAATGEWIYFLDSDDHLADCFSIARLFRRAKETGADLVVGSLHFNSNDTDISPASGPEWLIRCLDRGDVSFAGADVLCRRERCLAERFEVGLVHEDEDWSPRVIFGTELVTGVNDAPTYVRVKSEGSITTAKSEIADFKRSRGKLIVCRNTLDDVRFRTDSQLWQLQQARAYGFANMAFKCWARNVVSDSLQKDLSELATSIDYSYSEIGKFGFRNIITWLCMQLVRLLGPIRYVSILRTMYRV